MVSLQSNQWLSELCSLYHTLSWSFSFHIWTAERFHITLSKSSKPATAPTAGRIKDCAKKIIPPDECLCRQDARGKNATAAKHCVINITSNIINVWLSDEQRSTCANLKAYVRAKDIETHGLLVLDVFELPSHSVSTLHARTLRIFTPTAWPSAPWSLATSCII